MSRVRARCVPERERRILALRLRRGPKTPAGLRHRCRRSIVRPLVGIALIAAGILIPVESGSVPDPLAGMIGESPVSAQTAAIVIGEPDPCPETPVPWRAIGSNCVLETSACPASPLIQSPPNPAFIMLPSVGYPDVLVPPLDEYAGFCEHRIIAPGEPLPGVTELPADQVRREQYNACTNGSGGFAVKTHRRMITETVVDQFGASVVRERRERRCRLITQARCVVGLHRVASNTCRAVQRQTWGCLQGITTNEFNRCYVVQSISYVGRHLACRSGAPDFQPFDCDAYVDDDFVYPANSVACSSYPTGDPNKSLQPNPTGGLSSSDYWCAFDISNLKVACHNVPQPAGECTSATALCLKRASRTGGCDAIAHTISCRAMQAAFADPNVPLTVEEMQQAGCEPCVLLPLRPVQTECPADVTAMPATAATFADLRDALHMVKDDFHVSSGDCRAVREGTTLLQNDAGCLRHEVCADPPQGELNWRSNHFSQVAIVNSPVVVDVSGVPTTIVSSPYIRLSGPTVTNHFDNILSYDDNAFGDPIVRAFGAIDPAKQYRHVRDLAGDAECVFHDGPLFKIVIAELWPDIDDVQITSLLGPDALAWWNKLSDAEKEDRITARDVNWLTNPTPGEIDQERDRRSARSTEIVDCNFGGEIWCRWTPTRPGYFKLTGAAAWISERASIGRWWLSSSVMDSFRQNLGNTQFVRKLRNALTNLRLGATDVGVNATLTDALPPENPDDEWLYTSEAGDSFRCPAADVRIYCGGTIGDFGNYTETTPIGILVHEVRVATRAPNL